MLFPSSTTQRLFQTQSIYLPIRVYSKYHFLNPKTTWEQWQTLWGGGGVGRSAIALNIGYNQDILCEHCFSIETIGPPNIWLNFRQYCLQRRYDYLEKEPYRALAIEGS